MGVEAAFGGVVDECLPEADESSTIFGAAMERNIAVAGPTEKNDFRHPDRFQPTEQWTKIVQLLEEQVHGSSGALLWKPAPAKRASRLKLLFLTAILSFRAHPCWELIQIRMEEILSSRVIWRGSLAVFPTTM